MRAGLREPAFSYVYSGSQLTERENIAVDMKRKISTILLFLQYTSCFCKNIEKTIKFLQNRHEIYVALGGRKMVNALKIALYKILENVLIIILVEVS